jgi:hypothetical protein
MAQYFFIKSFKIYFSPKNETKNENFEKLEKIQEELLDNNKSNLSITENKNKNKINKSSQS